MYEQKTTIRQWAEDDRPREKLMSKGKNALSDAELIAILIGTGSGNKSAVDLARDLLALSNGNLYDFGKLRLAQLCSIKGIGESKAISILAALELGRRRSEIEPSKNQKIDGPKMVYELLKRYFADLDHEEFYVIFLNRLNNVIQIKQLSIGGTAATIVDAKILFKAGFDCSANSFIIAHNHPSGNLKPSNADIQLTKNIQNFAKMIDMPMLDHLIITDNGYFSFADQHFLE